MANIYNMEDVSVAQMLFDDEYDDFTENIPLRPVGPAVWRMACCYSSSKIIALCNGRIVSRPILQYIKLSSF